MKYPFPWRLLLQALRGRPCAFHPAALAAVSRLPMPLQVVNPPDECIDRCVITVNHYHQAGFPAWWLALAISAVIQTEIHWVITAAWTYPDWLRRTTITPASRCLLQRIARTYGFTAMPPMPPAPEEAAARARAVRRVLRYAGSAVHPLVGLAPEGGDFAPAGRLAVPPSGTGCFLLHLSELGLAILPVGIAEEAGSLPGAGRLRVTFGPPYQLQAPEGLSRPARDDWASETVMRRIEALL